MEQEKNLPNILYIADVPAELSYAGSTLIYRLLEFYPKSKLHIIQTAELNKVRIEGVTYTIHQNNFITKLSSTRFNKQAKELQLLLSASYIPTSITKIIQQFKPSIILTVTFGTTWILANKIAQKFKLPLHLILHDELMLTDRYQFFDNYFRKKFKQVYNNAASKMCVSNTMQQYYLQQYNVNGSVVYPSRGKNDIVEQPKKFNNANGLHYCYAGTVHTGDFLAMLDLFASLIEAQNAQLTIFSAIDKTVLNNYPNLLKPHVAINAMVTPMQLKQFMLQKVDVNLLINSFMFEEVFRYNFSSKVVDYSAVSLPILFFGSTTSGVIQWALNYQYPFVISENSAQAISKVLQQLQNSETREKAVSIIHNQFNDCLSYENNYSIFTKCLLNKQQAN